MISEVSLYIKQRHLIQGISGPLSVWIRIRVVIICACVLSTRRVFQTSSSASMPTPFSLDLRWRVVWLHLSTNYAPARIAQLMSVSERTVWRYISLFNHTGDVQPQKRRNGPRLLMGDFEQITLLRLILENPGIYLDELQDRLLAIFGVLVSVPTIIEAHGLHQASNAASSTTEIRCSKSTFHG